MARHGMLKRMGCTAVLNLVLPAHVRVSILAACRAAGLVNLVAACHESWGWRPCSSLSLLRWSPLWKTMSGRSMDLAPPPLPPQQQQLSRHGHLGTLLLRLLRQQPHQQVLLPALPAAPVLLQPWRVQQPVYGCHPSSQLLVCRNASGCSRWETLIGWRRKQLVRCHHQEPLWRSSTLALQRQPLLQWRRSSKRAVRLRQQRQPWLEQWVSGWADVPRLLMDESG